MTTSEIVAKHTQPERTCTLCGSQTTRYMVTSLDNRAVECSWCLRRREELDKVLKARMMSENQAAPMPKKRTPVGYEWQPLPYD